MDGHCKLLYFKHSPTLWFSSPAYLQRLLGAQQRRGPVAEQRGGVGSATGAARRSQGPDGFPVVPSRVLRIACDPPWIAWSPAVRAGALVCRAALLPSACAGPERLVHQ